MLGAITKENTVVRSRPGGKEYTEGTPDFRGRGSEMFTLTVTKWLKEFRFSEQITGVSDSRVSGCPTQGAPSSHTVHPPRPPKASGNGRRGL